MNGAQKTDLQVISANTCLYDPSVSFCSDAGVRLFLERDPCGGFACLGVRCHRVVNPSVASVLVSGHP